MTRKLTAPLTREQADDILAGEWDFLWDTGQPLLRDFYRKARTRLLRPSVIVDYDREAYVFRDVRITFDSGLRTGHYSADLFDPDLHTIPVLPPGQVILEVKFDDALPDFIGRLLRPMPAARSAVSKYELCRRYQ